ncbi:MAG: 50S ribosomal protein L29 [Phycisphaerae bacterium]|nr:50S ribosomal protein L29 [Phycisphaerae bacterium]
MKIAEIREMKSEELHVELEQLRRHAFDLRSQAVTEKLENPHQLTAAKRSIARILTVLRERGERDIEQRQRRLEAEAARRRRG